MKTFDRTVEDLGNIVFLEHVNVRIPDQRPATIFYVSGLGLTRDPFLMTGVTNMWVNVGMSQFHLPQSQTGKGEVLRGTTALVMPGRAALLARLKTVAPMLEGTKFSFKDHNDCVEAICPWGNRVRVYEPGPRFPGLQLGMPYVELDVPRGTAEGIARFYREIMGTRAAAGVEAGAGVARASVGPGQELVFRETDAPQPAYDGHHIAVYLADFSGPYRRLLEQGLVSEESDQHQYRCLDIVDPRDGRALFRLEHEVRSMRHPLYARAQVNRNPNQSNRLFAPGHETMSAALAAV